MSKFKEKRSNCRNLNETCEVKFQQGHEFIETGFNHIHESLAVGSKKITELDAKLEKHTDNENETMRWGIRLIAKTAVGIAMLGAGFFYFVYDQYNKAEQARSEVFMEHLAYDATSRAESIELMGNVQGELSVVKERVNHLDKESNRVLEILEK